MANRIAIPKAVEHDVLMRNQNVCCICRKSSVQIHHIDGNPRNNAINNLCVLCIEHHAQASSKSAMTKGLSPSLLRKYKKHWEGVISTNIAATVATVTSRHRTKVSRPEFANLKFEIKRTVFMLPTLRTERQIQSSLDYLYNLNLETELRKYIFKDINYLHWMMDDTHIRLIAKKLYEFFFHLVGPDKVPFRNNDKRQIVEAIDLLVGLGQQAIMFGYKFDVLRSVINTLGEFDDIARTYKHRQTQSSVRKAYKELQSACKNEMPFNKSKVLADSARLLSRLAK